MSIDGYLGHPPSYRLADVRCILTRVWGYAAAAPDSFRLVFQSPTTCIYQLDGSARYFVAAGCPVTSGDRDRALIVCPRRRR